MTVDLQALSFLRAALGLAAVVVILAGMHLAAPILNPVLFGLVFALIFSPLHRRLMGRGAPPWLSVLLLLCVQLALIATLLYIISASVARLSTRLAFYAAQLDAQIGQLDAWLASMGLTTVSLGALLSGDALAGLLGALLGALSGFLGNVFLIVMSFLFLLAEGPAIMRRLRASVRPGNPQVARLTSFGQGVIRQFGMRAVVNLVTAAGFTVFLLLLGVDFALLWGVLTFFLSYIPYIGIVLATAPAVLLALAEFGLTRALLVIAGVTVANVLAENVLSPMLMSRGLNLSPTALFLCFALWTWLLGAAGAFLAVPLTILSVLMLDTFPGTRWLAAVMVAHETEGPPGAQLAEATEPAA